MTDFEKWLREQIKAYKDAMDKAMQKCSKDDLLLYNYQLISFRIVLEKYQELNKDKIVLVLDKEEAENLYICVNNEGIQDYLQDLVDWCENGKQQMLDKLKQALEVNE